MSTGNGSPDDRLGGTVGSRIADLLTRATVATRLRMGPHQASIAQTVLRDFTNHVSDELRAGLGPLWTMAGDDPDMDPGVRALLHSLGTQRGQAYAWLAGTTTSIAMGAGFGTYFTNLLTPTLGAAIAATPNIRLSPGDAAAATVRGLSWGPDLATDAATSGINRDRFRTLTGLHSITLGAAEIMECINRGLMTPAQARDALRRSGYLHDHADYFFRLRERLVSTPDVAAMWNRGILSEDQAVALGARDGTTSENVKRYLELGGEAPPLQELLMAWRRGIVTEAQVDRALRQSPLRFEWIDVAKSLQWVPLPPAEVADAVNQGHMPRDRAEAIARESGVRPEDFKVIIDNAGLPPGLEVATEAWNRGLITEAEFERAFLESRLKNAYVPLYKRLRYRVIPQETVRRLYREGVYTRDQALTRLAHNGFSPDDAEALLAAEDGGAEQSTKELTKSEILSLLTDRAIDETTARDMLGVAGFGPGEIEWLVIIADLRRSRKYADAVIARVRAGFVGYRLDASEASSILDRLRVPVDQREELLDLWALERLATTRGLTAVQVKTALKKDLIDQEGALTRLRQQGYGDEDAEIFLRL